jgi:hypothetical protein
MKLLHISRSGFLAVRFCTYRTPDLPCESALCSQTTRLIRISAVDERISSSVVCEGDITADGLADADLIVALGVSDSAASSLRDCIGDTSLLAYGCSEKVKALQQVGPYRSAAEGLDAATQALRVSVTPWGSVARGERLLKQCSDLFSRNSSEDMLCAPRNPVSIQPRLRAPVDSCVYDPTS